MNDHEEECDMDRPGEIEIDAGYWKKGDDWARFLEQAKGDVPLALGHWALALEKAAADLRKLGVVLAEAAPNATGEGGTHYAAIFVDDALGAQLKAREDLAGSIVRWVKEAKGA